MTAASFIIWSILAAAIALKYRQPMAVYLISCVTVVIPIAISQTEFGLLPLAGVAHVLLMGFYPLGLSAIVKCLREKWRKQGISPR